MTNSAHQCLSPLLQPTLWTAFRFGFLRSAQRQQRDLRWYSNAHGEAESSKAAVHVERRFVQTIRRRGAARVAVHRQGVASGDKGRDQPCRANAVVDDLDLYMSAVS